jgi:hypothetical protein
MEVTVGLTGIWDMAVKKHIQNCRKWWKVGAREKSTFFFNFLVGVRPSPLGTSATDWPIVPASDDRWWWVWGICWNENLREKPQYSEKTCPSANLFTTNFTWHDLGSNPGCLSVKLATNCLSYCIANPQIDGERVWASEGDRTCWESCQVTGFGNTGFNLCVLLT